jgi:putative SOS response-associated peptidase YedK
MAMAGVWQDWEEEGQRIMSCAIFTTEANAKMAEIHHRLPVILGPND